MTKTTEQRIEQELEIRRALHPNPSVHQEFIGDSQFINPKRRRFVRFDLMILNLTNLSIWVSIIGSILVFLYPFSQVRNFQPFKDIAIFSIAITPGYVLTIPIRRLKTKIRMKDLENG